VEEHAGLVVAVEAGMAVAAKLQEVVVIQKYPSSRSDWKYSVHLAPGFVWPVVE
jgi:hypothetical protein